MSNSELHYEKVKQKWNSIFEKEESKFPIVKETGNETIDEALEWLTEKTVSVIDFGCGTGTVLMFCKNYGTKKHIGIDLSFQAINNARKAAADVKNVEFNFINGGIGELKSIKDASCDAGILFNIVDNLYPDDADKVLLEMKRILRPEGKLLVKLNPYLTQKEIGDWGIKIIDGNLLDDGMILWNNSTEEWNCIFNRYFKIVKYDEVYYPEYDQTNRLYRLLKI